MGRLTIILSMSLLLGCVSIEMPQEEAGEAWIFGKGCALIQTDTAGNTVVLIQHSGMSQALGDTIRSLVSVVGEVFGGSGREQEKLESVGGCEGMLESSIPPANGQGNTSE